MDTPPATRAPHAWLAILRPANVVTAAADILAGAAVAGASLTHPALPLLVAASASLYAGGVVLNDYCDRAIDRVERPERPIPSGRITPRAAATVGAALLLAGIALAAAAGPSSIAAATAVAAAVVIYDAAAKRHAFAGPLTMGACRALNLVLGMTIAPRAAASGAWLAVLPLTYIAGVTVLSRGEVAGGRKPVALGAFVLIAAVVAAAALVAAARPAGPSGWALVLALVLAVRVLPPYRQAWREPSPVRIRAAVRRGVLSLVLLDAVIAAAYADIMMSLAVLATAILAGWLARLFAVT